MSYALVRNAPDARSGYTITAKNPDPAQVARLSEYIRVHKIQHTIGPLKVLVTPETKAEMKKLVDGIKFTPSWYMWISVTSRDFIFSDEVYLRAIDENSWLVTPERVSLFRAEMVRGSLEYTEWAKKVIASHFMLINALSRSRVEYSPDTKSYDPITLTILAVMHYYDEYGNLKEDQ